MSHKATIRIGWPDKALSKNVSSPWGRGAQIRRTKATAAQRREAWGVALAEGIKHLQTERPQIKVTYHPPSKRKMDLHNVQSMLAGAIDGIQDAIGVDDRNFDISWPDAFSDVVKGGCVVFEVSE